MSDEPYNDTGDERLTVWDRFAIEAMRMRVEAAWCNNIQEVADSACAFADAMCKAREKRKEQK